MFNSQQHDRIRGDTNLIHVFYYYLPCFPYTSIQKHHSRFMKFICFLGRFTKNYCIVLYYNVLYCIVLYCIVLVSNLMSAVVWRILCVFFYSSQIMCKLSLAIHCGKKDIVLVPFIWSFSVMIYSLQIESQLSLAKAAVHIGCGTEDIVLVPFYPVLHWAACCVTGHQRTGENRTGSQTMDRDINIIPLNNF